MSILKKIGSFAKNTIRKFGDVGGKVLGVVGGIKKVADATGITSALQAGLMSNPITAPIGLGLAAANPAIDAGKGLMNAMSKV